MKEDKEERYLGVAVPMKTWRFLKIKSLESNMSIKMIVNHCLNKYIKKCEKKLTQEKREL